MDLLFFINWLFAPILWIFILKAASIRLLEVCIPSILFWFIIVFGYLGLPILYFGLDPFRSHEVTNKMVILNLFIFSSISITFLFVGICCGRRVIGPLKTQSIFNFSKVMVSYKSIKKILFFSFCILLICCYVLNSYIAAVGLENLALLIALDIFSGGDVTRLRSDATNNLENYLWFKLFTKDLLLFATLTVLTVYTVRRTMLTGVLSFLAIGLCVFSFTIAGEKGPIIDILVAIVFVVTIVNHRGYIPKKIVVTLILCSCMVIIPIYFILMGSTSVSTAIFHILSRLTTGQLQAAYVALEYIPEHRDYLLGKSFPNPGSIFPYEPVTITQELMAWYNPQEAKAGIVGSMPSMFWVEAYLNFSTYSLPLISLVIGFMVYIINWLILRIRQEPLVISFYVWNIIFFKNLSVSFFSDMFINLYLYVTTLFFFVSYLLVYNAKIRVSNVG